MNPAPSLPLFRSRQPVRAVLMFFTGVLVAGIGLVVWGEFVARGAAKKSGVLAGLAFTLPEWTTSSLPLGSTPELSETVEKTLRYDEAANVNFQRGDFRISAYAGYWGAGKAPVHMVARHTPDICWVASGWAPLARETRTDLADGAGGVLRRAEHRIFRHGETVEHVVFFHVIDGEIRTLAEADAAAGPLLRRVNDLFRYEFLFWHIGRDKTDGQAATVGPGAMPSAAPARFGQRREQLFVRLSSNRPLAEFWSTPVVAAFLRQLPLSRPAVSP